MSQQQFHFFNFEKNHLTLTVQFITFFRHNFFDQFQTEINFGHLCRQHQTQTSTTCNPVVARTTRASACTTQPSSSGREREQHQNYLPPNTFYRRGGDGGCSGSSLAPNKYSFVRVELLLKIRLTEKILTCAPRGCVRRSACALAENEKEQNKNISTFSPISDANWSNFVYVLLCSRLSTFIFSDLM